MINITNLKCEINNTEILNNINLDIPLNSIVSIIGLNGCGKTTLLKCLNDIIPYKGQIKYGNNILKDISLKEKAKTISYLPQNYIIPNISIKGLVQHGRYPHLEFGRRLSVNDKKKINDAIAMTKLENLKGRYIATLSGGQRQRAYIAMAIAQDTDVILLDEPTTFLDINYQLEIFEIILQLKEKGKSIIMVLHDLQQAFTYSDYIIVMDKGEVIAMDTPTNLVGNSCIKNIFGINVECQKEDKKLLYPFIFVKE